MDISVILPVVNERDNLEALLPRLKAILERERLKYEIIVVNGKSTDRTPELAAALGARVLAERTPGYAGALSTGFREARGAYLLTLDADLSHEPDFVTKMWRAREHADIVVASRYVRGGAAYTSFTRKKLSAALNRFLRRLLSVPIRDLSSGFRLYRREVLKHVTLEGRNFDVLEEILVKAYAGGFSVTEVPFTYFPRGTGRSHARLVRFGFDIARSTLKLWRLRNSVDSADYDERAFYSIIPVQRYWQRRRHRVVLSWARGAERVLDAGCGSSVIVQSLNNVVGMDFAFPKLRFLRRYRIPLAQGSAFALPFANEVFDCVISSQVIEHVVPDEVLFAEMHRVLRPGGRLIVGTPDYDTISWRIIEPIYGFVIPGGYRHEHITHYTRAGLERILESHGFAIEKVAYVAGSELILRCRKVATASNTAAWTREIVSQPYTSPYPRLSC